MTMMMMRQPMMMMKKTMTMIMRTLSSNLGRDLLDRQLGSHLVYYLPQFSVLTILIFCCISDDTLSVRPVVESSRPQWDWWRVTWRLLKIHSGGKSNNCKCTVEKRHSGEKSSRWQGTWQALHINRFSLPPVLLHFPIACVTEIISPLPVQIISPPLPVLPKLFPHCLCHKNYFARSTVWSHLLASPYTPNVTELVRATVARGVGKVGCL